MHDMLDQQRHESMNLLAQEIANSRGRAPMVNEPVVMEQVNNKMIPSHPQMVQEGSNDDSESYHGADQPEVRKNGELRGYCKHEDFMTCNPSYFIRKEDLIRVMDWIFEMKLTFIRCGCTGKLQSAYARGIIRDQLFIGATRWVNR